MGLGGVGFGRSITAVVVSSADWSWLATAKTDFVGAGIRGMVEFPLGLVVSIG
jgi:hypothetical protein